MPNIVIYAVGRKKYPDNERFARRRCGTRLPNAKLRAGDNARTYDEEIVSSADKIMCAIELTYIQCKLTNDMRLSACTSK